MNITENFLELVDIEEIILDDDYINMVDISVDIDSSFLLSNGLVSHNSASSAFRKYRDPQYQGAFSLRGKFINAAEINTQKLIQNNEVINLMGALGLKLGQKVVPGTLRYGRILFYCDADCLDEETIIVTKDVDKKMRELTYEDSVLTHTGEYKKIKNIVQKNVSNYIKIRVNGNTIICSEDHNFLIFRDGNVVEMSAKNIKYSDFFLLKK